MKHACETDHVAAVCTFVARGATASRAARLGALWGLGHGAVMILAGGALVVTGATVPRGIALALDAAVVVMLVGLGVSALLSRTKQPDERAKPTLRHPWIVGLVHGASGTAALSLLVASTMDTQLSALVFVGVFGLSAVLAMASLATLVAWSVGSLARRSPSFETRLQTLAGFGSIAAGLAVAMTMV